MIRKNKKAVTVVVSAALLIIVAVASTMGFVNWMKTYDSNLQAKTERKSEVSSLEIDALLSLDNNYVVYINNRGSEYYVVDKVKVDKFDCDFDNFVITENGVTKFTLQNCSHKTSGRAEIVFFTDLGIFQESVFIR